MGVLAQIRSVTNRASRLFLQCVQLFGSVRGLVIVLCIWNLFGGPADLLVLGTVLSV